MAVTHSHSIGQGAASEKLRTAFFLTAAILLVEVAGGVASHSLALLSDAGHVLTDILALGLAWFAAVRAGRPADARNTYGYYRTGILAALANAVTLLAVVVAIIYEAIRRLQHPETVTPWLMIATAAVGIAINLYIVLGLHAEQGESLNISGAVLHALGDIGASAGVIVGGLIILLTGWSYADPLISLAIAALVARSAWQLLWKAVDILMESAPRDLNSSQLLGDIRGMPGVVNVHDLHIWSIAGGRHVLSAHVQVEGDCSAAGSDTLIGDIHNLLCQRYHISHTTIQIEHSGCGEHNLFCSQSGGEHRHVFGPDGPLDRERGSASLRSE